MQTTRQQLLHQYYTAMLERLGPSGWWPATTPLEVCIGAVLTQNTAWTNVTKALANLSEAGVLHDGMVLLQLSDATLEVLIRPAGFFRQKAVRLKVLLRWLAEHGGLVMHAAGGSGGVAATLQVSGAAGGSGEVAATLQVFGAAGAADGTSAMHGPDPVASAGARVAAGGSGGLNVAAFTDWTTDDLRAALLSLKGIGPETADSILLYALQRPSFVVDAYTYRIFHRHGLVPEVTSYDEMRDLFMDALEPDVAHFNEFHALIVRTCKQWCAKRKPLCGQCPLGCFLDGEAV